MKTIVNSYRAQPLHNRVLAMVYACVAAVLVILMATGAGDAHAQAGNIYAPQQAQQRGDVWEAQVLQVSIKEVEPSTQARIAGGAVGGALGVALAARSDTKNRFAANTVGAVLGGLLGERATSTLAKSHAQEIILRLHQPGQQPRNIIIVQPAPFDPVYSGEMVYITAVGGAYRVLRRDGQVIL